MKVRRRFLEILTGSDLARRRLPILSAVTDATGPVVWLTGCMHGDEIGGTVVIHEVFKRLRRRPLHTGALHAFPLLNPLGFETVSRGIVISEEDLNRAFPGDPDGSFAERVAAKVFATIMDTGPALVIDLHNDWRRSIPYTLIDPYPGPRHKDVYRRIRTLAESTGFPVVRDVVPAAAGHSLSYSLLQRNVPALTLELGESFVVNEQNVAHGVESVWGLLGELGLVDRPSVPFQFDVDPRYRRRLLDYVDRPFSATSGIVRFRVKPGAVAAEGTVVAQIYDAFGRPRESLNATQEGLVLGHDDSAVSYPGKPMLAFAVPSRRQARGAGADARG